MDLRSLVRLAAAVLGLLAVGLLLTGTLIAAHGGPACGTEMDPCDGSDQALDAATATFYAIKALAFGTGASLGLASLLILGYLGQTRVSAES